MRALFVAHSSDRYGASRSLLRLAARLAADRHEVRVLLPEPGPLTALLEMAGVSAEIYPDLPVIDRATFQSPARLAQMLSHHAGAVRALSHRIAEIQPDVVHSNVSVLLTPGPAAAAAGIPHVWHIREIYAGFGPLWPFYRNWQARTAKAILAISSDVAAQFPEAWKRSGHVVTVYDGFPAAEFSGPFTLDTRLIKSSLETVNVGVLGRIKWARKGQEVLIRAMGVLRDSRPHAHCFVVGAPFRGNESHLDAMRKLARELNIEDRVFFLGEVEDPRSVYPGLDILVAPAAAPEPFGNVIAEAMAFGKPVVATRLGGPREIIEDGKTGCLTPPGDHQALAEALRPLIADATLRQRMGEAARLRYEKMFEMEPYYQRVLSVYRRLTPKAFAGGSP